MAREDRVISRFDKLKRSIKSQLGHMVHIDDHSHRHHVADERIEQRRWERGIALTGLSVVRWQAKVR